MIGLKRSAFAATAVSLAFAGAGQAQIPGMPLFTNPRYVTGLRIHADAGQDLSSKVNVSNLQVLQAGASLALGPVGLSANLGAQKNDIKSVQTCTAGSGQSCDLNTKVVASAMVQLRIMGGGLNPLALSIFGGASTDLNAYDTGKLPCSSFPSQYYCDSLAVKRLTIPVGASLGMRAGPLTIWGAPRWVLSKAINCRPSVQAYLCDKQQGYFRWAAGADLPILGILALRAAFDSGKEFGTNVNRFGVGASIGIGGVH